MVLPTISARCVHWPCLAGSLAARCVCWHPSLLFSSITPQVPWFVSAHVDRIFARISCQTGVWSEPNQERFSSDWEVQQGGSLPGGSPTKKKKRRKKAKCTLSPGHNKFQQMEPPDLTSSSGLSLPRLLANQHGLSTQLESRFLQLLCLRGFPSRRAVSPGGVCPWGFSLP